MSTARWVGVDVAKAVIDVARGVDGPLERIERTESELQSWAKRLPRGARVVMEATGGYERLVAQALAKQGVLVSIVNPRQVRDFAKATGKLAKTDRLDARVLAHFGEALDPRVTPLKSAEGDALRALLDRRRQLVDARTAEKNRRKGAPDAVIESVDDHIEWLDQQIDRLDREIEVRISQCSDLADRLQRLQTVPGVGRIVAITLLTHVPELGAVGRKEIAALVGLAPFARDSGGHRGRRAIWGGRSQARAMLFLAARVASRCNPPLSVFYERLLANGKSKKVAFAAVARKLAVLLNAMARDEKSWEPASLETGCC